MTDTTTDESIWWHGSNARVFISCGQRGRESAIAQQVRDKMRAQHFCPFLAIRTHSSTGLTDEIYRHLRTAEYVLFIDFRRERLGLLRRDHRGSVFSHQELGIASYLDSVILPFVQRGVIREGLLGQILGNAVPFSDPAKLPDLVLEEVARVGCDPTSRRELHFERQSAQFEDADWPDGTSVRYFHVQLVNRHRSEAANDCRVYLTRWKNLGTNQVVAPEPVELKFKHVTSPSISITPGRPRSFDAVIVSHEKPYMAVAGVVNPMLVDSGRALNEHRFIGPGDFQLEFGVWSREFAEVAVNARLHLGSFMKDASFSLLP